MAVGVIGLGDMGSGLAKNLMKNGFERYGLDLHHPCSGQLDEGLGLDQRLAFGQLRCLNHKGERMG